MNDSPDPPGGAPGPFRPTEYIAPIVLALLVLAFGWWLIGVRLSRAQPQEKPPLEIRLPEQDRR